VPRAVQVAIARRTVADALRQRDYLLMQYINVDLVKLALDSQHKRSVLDGGAPGEGGWPGKNDSHDSIVLSRKQCLHAFVLECNRKEAFPARFIVRVALGLLLWRLRPLWRFYDADVTIAVGLLLLRRR
jgi:hypothetical protein